MTHAVPVIGVIAVAATVTCIVTVAVTATNGSVAIAPRALAPAYVRQPSIVSRVARNPVARSAVGGLAALLLAEAYDKFVGRGLQPQHLPPAICGPKCQKAAVALPIATVTARIAYQAYRDWTASPGPSPPDAPDALPSPTPGSPARHPPSPPGRPGSPTSVAEVPFDAFASRWVRPLFDGKPSGIENVGAVTCYANSVMQMLTAIDPVVDHVMSIGQETLSGMDATLQRFVPRLQRVMAQVLDPLAGAISYQDSLAMFEAMRAAIEVGAIDDLYAPGRLIPFARTMLSEQQCADEYLTKVIQSALVAIGLEPVWERALTFTVTRHWVSDDQQYTQWLPDGEPRNDVKANLCSEPTCSTLLECLRDGSLSLRPDQPREFGKRNVTRWHVKQGAGGGTWSNASNGAACHDVVERVSVTTLEDVKQMGSAALHLNNAPPYLLVHTPRYCPRKGNHRTTEKVFQEIDIPEVLDMSPAAMPGLDPADFQYRLVAAVLHMGATIQGGHYVALKRQRSTGQWWLINDGAVSPMCDYRDRVLGGINILNSSAYLLYQRQQNLTLSSEERYALERTLARPLSPTRPPSKTWPARPNGIPNLGAMSYANSVMQLIASIPYNQAVDDVDGGTGLRVQTLAMLSCLSDPDCTVTKGNALSLYDAVAGAVRALKLDDEFIPAWRMMYRQHSPVDFLKNVMAPLLDVVGLQRAWSRHVSPSMIESRNGSQARMALPGGVVTLDIGSDHCRRLSTCIEASLNRDDLTPKFQVPSRFLLFHLDRVAGERFDARPVDVDVKLSLEKHVSRIGADGATYELVAVVLRRHATSDYYTFRRLWKSRRRLLPQWWSIDNDDVVGHVGLTEAAKTEAVLLLYHKKRGR
ncbi:USP domain-containing protein [Plasmodiophora brassicae]